MYTVPTWILASFIAEQTTPNSVASNCASFPLCGFCEWGFGSDSWAAWLAVPAEVQSSVISIWTTAITGLGSSGGSLSDSWQLGVGCRKGRSVPVQGFSPWIFLRWLAPAGKGNLRNWGRHSNAFYGLTSEVIHWVLILHESVSAIMNVTEEGLLEVVLVLAAASHTIVRVVVLWLALMPERYLGWVNENLSQLGSPG